MPGDEIGEILYSFPNNLNWKIPRLSDLPQQCDSRIWSPKFGSQTIPMKFDEKRPWWHFYFTPESGKKPIPSNKRTTAKWIKLNISFESENTSPVDWVRVGVVDETGKVINTCDCVWSYTYGVFSEIKLVKEPKLKLRQCGAIPNGYLQLYCEKPPKICTPILNDATDTGNQTAKNFLAITTEASTSINSSTNVWDCTVCLLNNRTCDLKCNACDSPNPKRIKNTDTTLPAESNTASLEKLSQNFREVFREKKDTDLTIKVKGQEFNVHKLILRARSTVFDDILSNKQRDKKTPGRKTRTAKKPENVIEIEECDPGVFEEFLLFVYSGKIENMTRENVYGLYDAGDKYKVADLKGECITFLKENFSLENICEIIRMAKKHNETELLDDATGYFAMHMDEILTTSNWMSFLKEDHVEANNLCSKALRLGFTKKDLTN